MVDSVVVEKTGFNPRRAPLEINISNEVKTKTKIPLTHVGGICFSGNTIRINRNVSSIATNPYRHSRVNGPPQADGFLLSQE